jgi:hypothetical protein
MPLVNILSLLFALFFEVFKLAAEHQSFGGNIRIGTVAISPEFVHFFVEIMDWKRVFFCLASQQSFCFVGLFEGDKIVIFLDVVVALDSKGCDVSLRIDIDLDTICF